MLLLLLLLLPAAAPFFFQSFQFLVDVLDFKNEVVLGAEGDEKGGGFKGFGGFLAVVNDYIKDGSHSEVNVAFRTKRDILEYARFDAYSSLELVRDGGSDGRSLRGTRLGSTGGANRNRAAHDA